MLHRVDSCRTRVDLCWLVSDSCWFMLICVGLVMIRVDSYRIRVTLVLTRVDSCWLVLTCVDTRARARACVCMCVCVHPSTMEASSVWIRWDTREQINDVMLKMLNSSAVSSHRYLRKQNLTFQLAALSCLQTKSRQSHDLTSVRLAFRTWGLHSPFSRRCLRYALHRERICFCVNTHKRVRYLSRKG